MFTLIQQVFILLTGWSRWLATKHISLNNKPSLSRPNLINLNPNELGLGLTRWLTRFATCNRNYNNPFGRIYVPNKKEDVDKSFLIWQRELMNQKVHHIIIVNMIA